MSMSFPNANLRAQLTPSGRGKRSATDAEPADVNASDEHRPPDERRRAMIWAEGLKRVLLRASCPPPFGPTYRLLQFAPGDLVGIDVSTCVHCGGAVRIVASIEEPTAIRAILAHFAKHGAMGEAHYRPPTARATGRGHGRVVARSATLPTAKTNSH